MLFLIEVNVFRRAANKTAQVSNKMTGIKTRRHISITPHRQHQAVDFLSHGSGSRLQFALIAAVLLTEETLRRELSWSSDGHGCIS